MSFFTNRFSGQTYTEMGPWLTNNDTGETFTKVGSTWIGSQGEYIQRQGQHWVNNHTGTSTAWGDPFGEDE